MPIKRISLLRLAILTALLLTALPVFAAKTLKITETGAVGDGKTLNTASIQTAIDRLASGGGGKLIIPSGTFLSGAIFLKPKVDLFLESGAILKGSTDIRDYPKGRTRIEGQFTDWIPALVNADGCNGLKIEGSGTLDGSGQFFYTAFWDARAKDSKVTNLAVERPRLMFIQNSNNVRVNGLKFFNSGFWNLHIYRSRNVLVEGVSFDAPFGAAPLRGPSTDGIDIDSCQYVTVRKCTFSVNDDSVCLKGTKGPFAMDDKLSQPTEHIRVTDCDFKMGHGVVTLGSEATIIRDVIVENSRVYAKMPVVRLKLRPDTPQLYENLIFRNITLTEGDADIFEVRPWTQFFDLKGQPPPKSIVRNVTLTNIKGAFNSFGELRGNPGQTEISDITLKNVDIQLKKEGFDPKEVKNLRFENVTVNGKRFNSAL